jgi:hypothetical protein
MKRIAPRDLNKPIPESDKHLIAEIRGHMNAERVAKLVFNATNGKVDCRLTTSDGYDTDFNYRLIHAGKLNQHLLDFACAFAMGVIACIKSYD